MQSNVLIFLLITQLTQNILWAQVRITPLNLRKDNWLSYSFPLVQSSNKQAASKINSYLQFNILDNENVLTDTNTIFEKSRYINTNDSNSQAGYSAISYMVSLNSTTILSLKFEMESTGAYSENYPMYYSFDSHTGDLLMARDLFTENGIAEIKKLLIKDRKASIAKWIKEMEHEYNINDDSVWINETFSECNAKTDENNFLIKTGSIIFCKAYCFPHVSRPYDTDLDIKMSYKAITHYLSEKGKKLLFQNK